MYSVPVIWDYRITQWFGERVDFYKPRTTKWHPWLDYAHTKAWTKQDVVASKSGTIVQSWKLPGRWNYIVILHTDWMETIYAHLSSRSVIVGESVTVGQKIWVTGTTWNSSWIHLHFGIRPNKRRPDYNENNWYAWWVDPNQYLNKYKLSKEDEAVARNIMRANSEARDNTDNLDFRYTLEQHNEKFRSKFWL